MEKSKPGAALRLKAIARLSPQEFLMLTHLNVSKQRNPATKRIVLCCGFVCLSFLALVVFGLLPRTHASENTLPARQVPTTATETQPKLVARYGKLPLSFEANQGQTDSHVRFLARGGGYTIFLTDDETVLNLRKSQPGMSRLGKFSPPNRLDPFALVDPRTGDLRRPATDSHGNISGAPSEQGAFAATGGGA
jgi:hypothetical protein